MFGTFDGSLMSESQHFLVFSITQTFNFDSILTWKSNVGTLKLRVKIFGRGERNCKTKIYLESIKKASRSIHRNKWKCPWANNWLVHSSSISVFSVQMVLMWTCGDIFKTTYFYLRKTPLQFVICGSLQVCIDLLILCQVWVYRENTARRKKSEMQLRA